VARSERSLRHREDFGDPEDFVKYFKERVYATFTGLAIVLVVGVSAHPTAEAALVALLLGVAGITAAGFVSDIIAHLAVHENLPDKDEWMLLLRVAGGGLSTLVAPAVFLVLAIVDVMHDDTALRVATIIYVVTLAVIGLLVVRRSRLTWWQQLLVLAVLVALGLVVIGIQALAHGLGGEH
jgi:hypothetical protein